MFLLKKDADLENRLTHQDSSTFQPTKVTKKIP